MFQPRPLYGSHEVDITAEYLVYKIKLNKIVINSQMSSWLSKGATVQLTNELKPNQLLLVCTWIVVIFQTKNGVKIRVHSKIPLWIVLREYSSKRKITNMNTRSEVCRYGKVNKGNRTSESWEPQCKWSKIRTWMKRRLRSKVNSGS